MNDKMFVAHRNGKMQEKIKKTFMEMFILLNYLDKVIHL